MNDLPESVRDAVARAFEPNDEYYRGFRNGFRYAAALLFVAAEYDGERAQQSKRHAAKWLREVMAHAESGTTHTADREG